MFALHILLVWGWTKVLPPRLEGISSGLQATWIELAVQRFPPVPPLPTPPERPAAKGLASPRLPVSMPAQPAQEASTHRLESTLPEAAEPRLFDGEGRVRVPDADRAYRPWDDADRIRRDRPVALPGHSDSAAAEKVALRLRRAMSPEDVVVSVLRFLFGRVEKDDCRTIERRLVMSDPDVVREIDLNKFKRICTP